MDSLDRARLDAIAAHLQEPVATVARTLHAELSAERARIDAGLGAGDLETVGDAVHAARNSALMIDAGPVIAGLREVQRAVRADAAEQARAAAAGLQPELDRLLQALAQVD